jgi:uncharacterized membrane protein
MPWRLFSQSKPVLRMEKIVTKGQLIFGLAITGFGIENLICAHFGLAVRGVPWFPGNPLMAYLIGAVFIAAGLSIAANVQARLPAILLGYLFLLYVLLFEIGKVAANPLDVSVRTVAFETLAMCGSAFILAGTDRLARLGAYFFAVSALVFGIDHFLVLAVIASLVPGWIPWHFFWAWLTGAAFIAAGICIAAKWLDRWAATLLGIMFMLWFFLLHCPRAVTALRTDNPNVQNEWSSALIAMAMWGGSWMCARNAR